MTSISLLQLERTGRLCSDFEWQARKQAYECLRPAGRRLPILLPSALETNQPTRRHAYCVATQLSPCGDLVAFARSDGYIEVHQPCPPGRTLDDDGFEPGADAQSLRLQLSSGESSATFSDALWDAGRDALLVGRADRTAVLDYDLETCREDRPTRVYSSKCEQGPRGITDLTLIDRAGSVATVAACYFGSVLLIDRREKRPSILLTAPTLDNVVTSHGDVLYVCGDVGDIKAYDLRNLPSTSCNIRQRSQNMLHRPLYASAGTALGTGRDSEATCVSQFRVQSPLSRHKFNFAQTLSDGTRVAFQLGDGTVGVADFATRKVHSSPERTEATPMPVTTGLFEMGARDAAMDDYPWYADRRRGCAVAPTTCDHDVSIIAPCVRSKGFRLVARVARASGRAPKRRKHEDSNAQERPFDAPEAEDSAYVRTKLHVASVAASADACRFYVGHCANKAEVYEVER